MALLQWVNGVQRLTAFGEQPVLPQFLAVFGGPFEHQGPGAAGQITFENAQRLNLDLCAPVGVVRMKMRRRMVIVVHPNRDAEKPADRGHRVPSNDVRDALPA
jgi:hypothetical protein